MSYHPTQQTHTDSTRKHRERLRTDSVDEVKVYVERDEWYRQQSEEQFQDAGDGVDVARLVSKRPRSITVYQRMTSLS